MNRFGVVCMVLFFPTCCLFAETPEPPRVENGVAWYDVATWDVQGRGWKDTTTPFTRLPARAEGKVTPGVWRHARNSSGLFVRFQTDAPAILVRHEVSGDLAMAHMTAVGTSGLDLYARDDDGRWHWAGASMPEEKKYEQTLVDEMTPITREFLLFLPLHNTTESLFVGVPAEYRVEVSPPSRKKPIVYYGTSIAHGGCASRPGMAYTTTLNRRFDCPVIGLGFSGSGRMEQEMAELIREIDAAAYVVDCLPNMGIEETAERAEPFLRKLRQTRPDTPIILVEDRSFANAWLKPRLLEEHKARRAALRATYEKLSGEGMKNLYYIKGDHLIGDDDEGTIDGSHLNDLGMSRMADTLESVLRKALAAP